MRRFHCSRRGPADDIGNRGVGLAAKHGVGRTAYLANPRLEQPFSAPTPPGRLEQPFGDPSRRTQDRSGIDPGSIWVVLGSIWGRLRVAIALSIEDARPMRPSGLKSRSTRLARTSWAVPSRGCCPTRKCIGGYRSQGVDEDTLLGALGQARPKSCHVPPRVLCQTPPVANA